MARTYEFEGILLRKKAAATASSHITMVLV